MSSDPIDQVTEWLTHWGIDAEVKARMFEPAVELVRAGATTEQLDALLVAFEFSMIDS